MLQPGRSLSREAIVKAVLAHGQERGENYRIRWDVAKLGEARVVSDAVPFRAPLLAGGEIEFRPRQGRPAVVVFWASWCKPCIDEAPHLERLYKQHGTEVEFISVSIDEARSATRSRSIPVASLSCRSTRTGSVSRSRSSSGQTARFDIRAIRVLELIQMCSFWVQSSAITRRLASVKC